jgi:RimJ/RimL family protein N-acetyltransferase
VRIPDDPFLDEDYMDKIRLTGKDITLIPYDIKHAEQLTAAARESVAEVSPWLPWCHTDFTIEESKNWIELCTKTWNDGSAYQFVITDSRDGSYLGGCGLNQIRPMDKVANLGYWVRSSRVKHGIATAATLLLADFGFKELKFNRIEILAAVENKASQRVATKAGALREGILRNRLLLHGAVHDAVIFSLIPQ